MAGAAKIDAVIFCASASTKGGDANSVDRDGVINTAKICLELNISRLIVISSCCVTRPWSLPHIFLNIIGNGIMTAKLAGENGLKALYATSGSSSSCSYTIIRPGHLTQDPGLGPGMVEILTGDQKSGRISREDVADLAVACASSEAAANRTFECMGAKKPIPPPPAIPSATAAPGGSTSWLGIFNMRTSPPCGTDDHPHQNGSSSNGGIRGVNFPELLEGVRSRVL